MRTHTHNALHIKKQIQPKDYRRDQNCQILNKNTGKMVSVPIILIEALRNGQLEMK